LKINCKRNVTGWNFIGFDSAGNQQFDVGGESFTLFVVNNQEILRNDKSFVELIPIVRPSNPTDLDAEIATLEEQVDAINATESSLGTRISDIGAPQQGKDGQEGNKGRPSSKVIGNLVQGGFGTGLPGDEGAGTGGLGGGFGPGAGEEGDETGSGKG
jgi:hypothetical protein